MQKFCFGTDLGDHPVLPQRQVNYAQQGKKEGKDRSVLEAGSKTQLCAGAEAEQTPVEADEVTFRMLGRNMRSAEQIWPSPPLPKWYEELRAKGLGESVRVLEWYDEAWRAGEASGFMGVDFIHASTASVRVLDYLLVPPTAPTRETSLLPNEYFSLIGAAYFSPRAESHRGLCHGGSFCALMDDVIGWLGFCYTGIVHPWTGFTAQIDTSLKAAVPVHSILRIEATVDRLEGSRKVWIQSKLWNPVSGVVHCTGKGLFLRAPAASEQ